MKGLTLVVSLRSAIRFVDYTKFEIGEDFGK